MGCFDSEQAGIFRIILSSLLLTLTAGAANAQRAAENAVTLAKDAFGTSVGNEQIGLYTPFNVRGFSPTIAGNVRIDGLYFDQVTQLNNRLQQSSAIRVGIAAQGYAFPAPTGVVDYTLRVPGDTPLLSSYTETNTRGTTTVEFDGAGPVAAGTLNLGGGVGYHRDVGPDGSSDYANTEGVLADWTPAPGVQLLPFWSRTDFYHAHPGLVYSPAGPFLPAPIPGRHFFGPVWAINREIDSNYGVIARWDFLSDWDLRAGLFRSTQNQPDNIFVQLGNLNQQGQGEASIVANPPSEWGSTSGEVRLEHTVSEGPLTHRAILSVRLRGWSAIYGGADSLDLGAAQIGQRIVTPEPEILFTQQTHDHIRNITPGLSYQVAWQDVGILGLSIQKPQYRRDTLSPGLPPAITTDDPWLFNADLRADLSQAFSLYADTTGGLEDNGIAPQNATNNNQALPAIVSRQEEVGLRWFIKPQLAFVTGLFDIHKPYFNLNAANLYTQLGEIQNKGLEISLSGGVLPNLDIVAGAVFAEPSVTGEAVRLGDVGHRPVGIPSVQSELNANWRPPGTANLSFDLTADYQTRMASTLDDMVSIPDRAIVGADMRYGFKLADRSASFRLWVENILDRRYWDLYDAGAYNIYWNSGRRVDIRLIVDI